MNEKSKTIKEWIFPIYSMSDAYTYNYVFLPSWKLVGFLSS